MSDSYPPVQHAGYSTPPRGSGMAIASMVLGIVSLVFFCIPYLAIPCAILAVVLGIVARGRAVRGEADGKGMATAGIICGAIAILIGILLLAGALAFIGYAAKHPELQQKLEEMQRQQQGLQTSPSALLRPVFELVGWRA